MANKVLPTNALAIIESLGASSLPNNPTGKGFTAGQIKIAIDRPVRLLTEWVSAFDTLVAEQVVHLAGEETITGKKNFSGGAHFSGANVSFGSSGSDNSKQLDIYFTTNLRGPVYSNTIIPANTFALGSAEHHWGEAYINNLYVYTKIANASHEWALPSESGTIAMTSDVGALEDKVEDGTVVAKKAQQDASGNTITSTYETKNDATAKVAVANLRTILGLASTTVQGLMSATDKAHLDALYALLGDSADSDTVVNTINEVLAIFDQYPESVDLVTALAAKVAFSDVINNLESNEISKPLSAYQGKVLRDKYFAAAMFTVSGYNESTGEVTLEYSSSAITDITYTSSTGEIVFTY